jgi:hypothetical protein
VSGFANEINKWPVSRLSSCIKQGHCKAVYRAIQLSITSRVGSLYGLNSVAKKYGFSLVYLSKPVIVTVKFRES